jgi:S-adenosylmethionine synthetase
MFGYATNETDGYIPLTLDIAHTILRELAEIRKEGKKMKYLRPDAKSQITIEFDEETHVPIKIDTIVVSTQHDPFSTDKQMLKTIREDIVNILIPRVKKKYKKDVQKLFGDNIKYFINPTGRFVIGGPHGDTGLTGRKIIVDTYGGKVSHGGGAFSGKDPTKVDRSAAYATRHMAKNIVAAGVCDEVLVQVAYAIGVAKPVSIYINTMGTSKIYMTDTQITKKLENIFDLSPSAILKRLKLRNPIYSDTAKYGHFGKESFKKNGLEFYTWEKLDHVKVVKNALGIK